MDKLQINQMEITNLLNRVLNLTDYESQISILSRINAIKLKLLFANNIYDNNGRDFSSLQYFTPVKQFMELKAVFKFMPPGNIKIMTN